MVSPRHWYLLPICPESRWKALFTYKKKGQKAARNKASLATSYYSKAILKDNLGKIRADA